MKGEPPTTQLKADKLLVAELTDLLEHPAAVHAGDLIGMGYRRSRTLVRHAVSTWYLRPMPMELPVLPDGAERGWIRRLAPAPDG
jgi:hypothetical protein